MRVKFIVTELLRRLGAPTPQPAPVPVPVRGSGARDRIVALAAIYGASALAVVLAHALIG